MRLKGDLHDAVIFDVTDAGYVDVSAALALEELLADAVQAGERIYLSGLSSPGGQVLEKLSVADRVPAAQRHAARAEAVRQALAATAAAEVKIPNYE